MKFPAYVKQLNKRAVIFVLLLIAVFISFISFLSWGEDEIGNGKNKDYSDIAAVSDAVAKESYYGAILHHGKLASKPIINGAKVADGVTAVYFVNRDREVPSVIALVCEGRTNTWAIWHNTLDQDGQALDYATDVSIMNYRKGVVDIREKDETNPPVISTANGDMYVIEGLKKLIKLDPESTIAFTLETQNEVGESTTRGWSALYKVKDVVAALKKVDLNDCSKAEVGADGIEIQYQSTEEIKAAGRQ